MQNLGYLEGQQMATAFNLLRSNDLIWPYVVNNYLRGKTPFPFDLLYWNADATRMPAANHSFYLRYCYLNNALAGGRMTVANVLLDLKKVKIPIYNLATREDHIAPARIGSARIEIFRRSGALRTLRLGAYRRCGQSGIAKGKYQYWTGPKPSGSDVNAWLKKATEHPGSWWPDWLDWIKALSDERVWARPARRRQAHADRRCAGKLR